MAQNYVQHGEVLPVVAPSGGYSSEQVIKAGSVVGIALKDAAEGETCEVALTGIWTVAKATGTAWSTGDKLYWDATNSVFTKTATSNTAAGYAAADALSAAASGNILLRQIA